MTKIIKQEVKLRTRPAARPAGAETTVFIPDTLRKRLGAYILDKYSGRMHVRNEIILAAIEALLKNEGY